MTLDEYKALMERQTRRKRTRAEAEFMEETYRAFRKRHPDLDDNAELIFRQSGTHALMQAHKEWFVRSMLEELNALSEEEQFTYMLVAGYPE
ncbi:hypothetical protein [Aeromonas caviae]|uniref:hypothetical protein n=1 Tax=Aeromonas caviae TaxID=648 RepID=UPI002B45E47F|nr:hypothetical protein [Aeromonas caviae]